MFAWILDNLANILVLAAVLLGVVAVILYKIKTRKKGGCHGCAGCPYAGSCQKQPPEGCDTDDGREE
jgi:hypothetical protein